MPPLELCLRGGGVCNDCGTVLWPHQCFAGCNCPRSACLSANVNTECGARPDDPEDDDDDSDDDDSQYSAAFYSKLAAIDTAEGPSPFEKVAFLERDFPLVPPTIDPARAAKCAEHLELMEAVVQADGAELHPRLLEDLETRLEQQLVALGAPPRVRLAKLAQLNWQLVGSDAGEGDTAVRRLQDAPHVWRSLWAAFRLAFGLTGLDALHLLEGAASDDVSTEKHPTVGTIRHDAPALVLRLAEAAILNPGRRVLAVGWMADELVQRELRGHEMFGSLSAGIKVTEAGHRQMLDETTDGTHLRRVEVVSDGKVISHFFLAVYNHPGSQGRGGTGGELEVPAMLLRALYDGKTSMPTLRIDIDQLRASA